MKNRWTLHVEDFGSIRSADIEVAPMMLFVGENNTGKSYLASLLWGILEIWDRLFDRISVTTNKKYKRCEELMIEYFNAAKSDVNKKIKLEQDIIDAEIEWFNEILNNEKDNLVQRIFSHKEIKVGKIFFKNAVYANPLFIKKVEDSEAYQFDCEHDGISHLVCYGVNNPETLFLVMKDLIPEILAWRNNSLYLPASRTGFMLSYKSLAAELFNLFGIDKREVPTTFTVPIIRFLQRLMKAEMSPEAPFADIAESLEKQVLKGKIIQNSQTQSFYYAPESNLASLMPLHITSSLVTELAPLIIFLRDKLTFDSLVFEEPESHLHLEAQRILAKHLVKLVNRGVPVWMTTHSDTMFQQFNNLIGSTENRIRKLKNLSYQDDEIIKPEDIKAYQFNLAEDGKTDVVPLKLTDDGFSASNFNHTLWNLSKESMSLEAD